VAVNVYDKDKADYAVNFIRQLKHIKDPWAGVPFTLLPWQEEAIRDIFGTVKADGYRQYNTAYIEIPKKNGKSELAAAIALLLLTEGEYGAEVYGCAADKGQASIVFDVAAEMVEQCPALRKRIKPVLSTKRLIYLPTKSFYRVLSADAFTKHGFNVHACIFDELHSQPNRGLYDVMTKYSGDARKQPLFFFITTAGDDADRKSVCWEVHEKARKIKEKLTHNETFYPVIYGIDEQDDWEDEANWYKANPSLGHTIDIAKVRQAYADAKENQADEKTFRQLRLNQWVKIKSTSWVSLDKWDATAGMVNREKLKGRKCFGGLDLSSKIDLTAYCEVFPPCESDDKWRILWDMWMPEENVAERVKQDGVPYDKWIKNGFIKTTPGNVIDYKFIETEISRSRDEFEIEEIGFDPWNAMQVALNLTEAGITMVEVRQGARSMSPAMKELEKLIVGDEIRHGGNPVVRWMFGNIQVKRDENDNIRPIKGKQVERIDGIVALINALSRAILHQDATSTYENNELFVI
jgi:phage terminase large subunit-like protein